MRLYHIAREQTADGAMAIEGDIHNTIEPDPSCHGDHILPQLRLDGPAALARTAQIVVHHSRGLHATDGREYDLGATGKPRHRMGIDAAHADLDLALHHQSIDMEREPGRRSSTIHQIAPTVMGQDLHRRRQPGSDLLGPLVGRGRRVRTARQHHRNVARRDPPARQLLHEERKQIGTRRRPRQIVDHDHGIALAPGNLRQPARPDRPREALPHGLHRQRRFIPGTDFDQLPRRGEVDRQVFIPEPCFRAQLHPGHSLGPIAADPALCGTARRGTGRFDNRPVTSSQKNPAA